MKQSTSWFRTGPLGRLAPMPGSLWGWVVTVGLCGPALVFAVVSGYVGQLLAVGLLAFLFGLAYAMADEPGAKAA